MPKREMEKVCKKLSVVTLSRSNKLAKVRTLSEEQKICWWSLANLIKKILQQLTQGEIITLSTV